jgi:hypothetical protein
MLICLALTVVGLYMSSLTSSSLRAFLTSLPAVGALVALFVLARGLSRPIGLFVFDATYPTFNRWLPEAGTLSFRDVNAVLLPAFVVLAAGLTLIVWRFALRNHSRAEDTARQGFRQALVVGTYVLAGASLILAVEAVVVAGLTPRSTISGVVVDENHNPVPGVAVSLAQSRYLAGQRRIWPVGRRQHTDAQGRFRLANLPQGDHMIVALTGGYVGASGPAGYAPTFHPGTASADAAMPVTVDGRTGVDDVTIELVRSVTARLGGVVHDEQGEPVAGAQVWVTELAPPAGVAPMFSALADSRADGSFEFRNMPAGDYRLQARSPRAPVNTVSPSAFSSQAVSLSGTDVADLEVTLQPGGVLRGTVVFEGSAPRPDHNVVRVSAQAADLVSVASRSHLLSEDWTFEISPLSGRYLVEATVRSTESPWALRDVRFAGRRITDTPLDFTRGEQIDGIEVAFTDRTGHVTGSVRDADGQATSDFMVVVFPEDPKGWDFPARQVHFVRQNIDGGFLSPPLLPGSYLVVATSMDFHPDDPQSPDWLAALRPLAAPVTVGIGDRITVALSVR